MRKATIFFVIVIAASILSCKSADNKVPEIASDICNCFSNAEKNISVETRTILDKAAYDDNPQKVLQEEIIKLGGDEQMVVRRELMSLGEMEDEKFEMGRCMKKVEKKYGSNYTHDNKKLGDKIIRELESKKGCDFTASFMKLVMKMQYRDKK